MHRLTRLLILASFALVWLGCGAPPEPVADVQSALNGHSTPPPGGWGTEPWLCSPSTWNPMTATWPAHGWCTWQPDPNAGILPWNVTACTGPAPGVGAMWIYSGASYAGNCAAIYGSGYPGYQWDSDLIQANGWLDIWVPRGEKAPHVVSIKSIRVGPSTIVYMCEGPFIGPPGAPCQVRSIGLGTQGQGINYPTVLYSDGSAFTVAAIQLGTS